MNASSSCKAPVSLIALSDGRQYPVHRTVRKRTEKVAHRHVAFVHRMGRCYKCIVWVSHIL